MKKFFHSRKAKAAIEFSLSSLKANNIQAFLFYLLILLLPTQFGRHFWPDFSLIKGIRVDYLSPTLYTTDILILLLLIFSIFSSGILNIKNKISKIIFVYWKLVVLVVFLAIGILFSKNTIAGWYGLIRLFEFGFLGFYIAKNIHRFKFQNIFLMLSIGIIFESFLSIAQFFNKGSLQGIFYLFGERFFNPQTIGIANASIKGELILRPYGTFSHPNVLAGYLTIAMAMVISNFQFQISNFKKTILLASIALGTVALFLTLSRIAIIIWVLFLGLFLVRKFIIHNSLFIILFLVGIISLGLASPLGSRFTELKLTDESIVQRKTLIKNSIAMIKDRPILGVGLNNFLVNLPSYQTPHVSFFHLQPVHNIFLLILAETGIVGFSFFVWFLIKTYRRIRDKGLRNKYGKIFTIYNLSLIITLGMFDHYFLTLQQGQLLFAFVFGLCWSEKPLK